MSEYRPGYQAVISNGQRAMHLQKVNVAVEVSDLAATSSAYFDTAAKVGISEELNSLVPDLRSFMALIARLREQPVQTRPHRTLIPAEVWRRGMEQFDDLSQLDVDIDAALSKLQAGTSDTEKLIKLASRLRQISRVFAELGKQELGALTDQRSPVA